MLLLLSIALAIGFGIVTAIPGLLPPAAIAVVTWSRVVSGIGWLGYGVGATSLWHVPSLLLPGILMAQIGYGLAVLAISKRGCQSDKKDE